jgi:hypothetical protein
MISFKKFLSHYYNFFLYEELNPEQIKMVSTWNLGKDFTGSPTRTVDLPLKNNNPQYGHPAVKDHLAKHGYRIKDYSNGIATKTVTVNHPVHGTINKEVDKNIGKALSETGADETVKTAYENDPNRKSVDNQNYDASATAEITSAPHQVAACSTGTPWHSCLNLGNGVTRTGETGLHTSIGVNHRFVKPTVEAGTHMAYLKNKDGDKIARIALQPYHELDENGSRTGKIGLKPSQTYGQEYYGFKDAVQNWADKNAPLDPTKDHELDERVYADGLPKRIQRERVTDSELATSTHNQIESYLSNDLLTPNQIDSVLKNKKTAHLVAHSDSASDKQFNKAFNANPDYAAAVAPHRLYDSQIDKTLPNMSEDSIRNANLNSEHIDRVLDNKKQHLGLDTQLSKLNPDQLDRLINNPDTHNMLSRYSSANLQPHHIDTLMHGMMDNYGRIQNLISQHKLHSRHISNIIRNASTHIPFLLIHGKTPVESHHIDAILNNDDVNTNPRILHNLVNNTALEPHHIDKIIDAMGSTLPTSIVDQKNLTAQHIHKIIDAGLPYRITGREDLTKEHIDKLLKIKDDDISKHLAHNPAIKDQDHIHKIIDNLGRFDSASFRAISQNPNLNQSHVDKLVDKITDPEYSHSPNLNFLNNPLLTREHMKRIHNDWGHDRDVTDTIRGAGHYGLDS